MQIKRMKILEFAILSFLVLSVWGGYVILDFYFELQDDFLSTPLINNVLLSISTFVGLRVLKKNEGLSPNFWMLFVSGSALIICSNIHFFIFENKIVEFILFSAFVSNFVFLYSLFKAGKCLHQAQSNQNFYSILSAFLLLVYFPFGVWLLPLKTSRSAI